MSNYKPFFSVIIPTYNRAHLIVTTIKSVLAQSYTNYEIIIVDDGSTDNTEFIIQGLNASNLIYFKTKNEGVAHARNYGITRANGNYVTFLDSDDSMETYHLQTAYATIINAKNPPVVHFNFLWGKPDRLITHKNKLPIHLPNDIFKNCSLHVNCVFIKNEIAQHNLFNTIRALMFAEDWDFFIKLAVKQPILLVDATTTYLTDHNDRSMRNFNATQWIAKRDAITQSLTQDVIVGDKYASKICWVTAHMNSLIAINYAVCASKKNTLKFWLLSLKDNVNELFTRRSLAIIKHLIFTW